MTASRINELEKLIIHHKERYYSGKQEIPDEAYDKLENELKSLDPDSPVLQIVGFKKLGNYEKVEHQKKMLSLDKTYDKSALMKWIGQNEVVSLLKIDGSSCSLVYSDGTLKMAKTRGDGQFGENITESAILIPDITKSLSKKKSFEVRGEIFCTEEGFAKIVEEMSSLGLDAPTSQRNIVAGLLGRKENLQLCRHLSFRAFDLVSEEKFKSESERLEEMKSCGLMVPDYKVLNSDKKLSEKDLDKILEETKTFMGEGDYLIDGLVLVYNELKLHTELGETGHHPRYKIAFKFEGEAKTARIQNIEWGVSRNGRLTPVAIIAPTELSGALITRVTLHNYGIVKSFNLKKGDDIEVVRSGEVIPKFLSVVKSSDHDFERPENCPSCDKALSIKDIWLCCDNGSCPSKIKEEILHYIRQAGIDDLSDKRLDEMLKVGLIKSIPHLYRLKEEDFLKLDKVKEKMASKLYSNIQKSRELKLIQFISAIGTEGVSTGSKIEKMINAGFTDLRAIQGIRVEDLVNIDGFAEKSAKTFVDSLESKKALIQELLDLGVTVKSETIEKLGSSLDGVTICITGELSAPRKEIEGLIKKNGGQTTGSVSKKTTYLLTNETDSSSSKFVKARELGIRVISEAEFMELIKR